MTSIATCWAAGSGRCALADMSSNMSNTAGSGLWSKWKRYLKISRTVATQMSSTTDLFSSRQGRGGRLWAKTCNLLGSRSDRLWEFQITSDTLAKSLCAWTVFSILVFVIHFVFQPSFWRSPMHVTSRYATDCKHTTIATIKEHTKLV